MRRRWFVPAAAALALTLAVLPGHAGADKKGGADDKKVGALMRRKLLESQRVLEGVALSDCDIIAKHAQELVAISKEAEWRVLKTPTYELHSNEFRRIAEGLIKNAKDNNADAAALSYVDLTLCCVKCHKYVREVRRVRARPPWEGTDRVARSGPPSAPGR
jgi:hypothetical protein